MEKPLTTDQKDPPIDASLPEKSVVADGPQSASNFIIEDFQIGVRKIRVAKPRGHPFSGLLNAHPHVTAHLPVLFRLATDIIRISPRYVLIFLLWRLWDSVAGTLELYLSNWLLHLVEEYISTRQVQGQYLLAVGVARGFVSALSRYIEWHGKRAERIVETRVTRHFQLLITKADISLDLVTSQERNARHEARAFKAYDSFSNIIQFASGVIQAMTQIALVISVSNVVGGPAFILLCLMRPLCGHLAKRTLRTAECVTFINNPSHQRLAALNQLAGGYFRQDILSNSLGDWILTEMKKAHDLLGDLPDYPSWMLFHYNDAFKTSALPDIGTGIISEIPMAFCICLAYWHPENFSIASLAILRNSTQQLHYSFSFLALTVERFLESVTNVEHIYLAAESCENPMNEGTVPYPPTSAGESIDTSDTGGMAFKLKNVSFSYPGAQSGAALRDVSLNIEAGSLVVLVGANGSGKSTLIRLLSGLYKPSPGAGALLIDGLPAEDYRMSDLYRAISLLSQENSVYPLSLGENISLGSLQAASTEEIDKAASLGGASEFISRFEKGMNTELQVFNDAAGHNLQGKRDHALAQELDKLPTDINISGGEKQRLVASRTFMKLNTGAVRFVAVDEPTSALDAEGELQLFNNLLAARKGKTMVFVTHRFGHLTKHADKIVCMKAGQIVEVGTHTELMKKENGEYANLYKIQANAYL